MKICVIIVTVMMSRILTESTAEQSAETQIQKPEVHYQVDVKTTITSLSNTVHKIASHLIKIIKNIGSSFVEVQVHPLKHIVSFICNAPSVKLFKDNLYFLFDKLVDIVFRIYGRLDDAWNGVSYIIESKLNQMPLCVLQIVDEMRTLSEQSEGISNDAMFTRIEKSTADLTMSVLGLTSITTSILRLINTRGRSVNLIVETITSLMLIHQYAVAVVLCLLSRAVIYSLDLTHAAGLTTLTATIGNFISNLQLVLLNQQKGMTLPQLFHGNLHHKLLMELLVSMNKPMDTKMINMINTTTASLVKKHAPRAFHILPDLIDQLTVISLRCGFTEFDSLEMCVTYAFDGLFDVLQHISYKLDKHIQSSASSASFQKPSEPIDTAVENIRTEMKSFIHVCQELSKCDTGKITTHLMASTSDLLQALLYPIKDVIRKSSNGYSITLASSLQFIALYVIGLIITTLIAITNSLRNGSVPIGDSYSNLVATLSLLFVKIQIMFDASTTRSASVMLKQLCESYDDLLQYMIHSECELDSSRKPGASKVVNAFVELAVNQKVEMSLSGS